MYVERVKPIDPGVLQISIVILAIGTLVLGAFFGALGVVLVYLGAKGTTNIKIFHTSFETTDVGIGALCVGATIVIAMLIRVSDLLKKSGGSFSKKVVIYGPGASRITDFGKDGEDDELEAGERKR